MKYFKMILFYLLMIIASIIVAVFVIFIPFGIMTVIFCAFACVMIQYTPVYVAIPVIIVIAAIMARFYCVVTDRLSQSRL